MEARPALSVIVPTHDTRELTLRCLRALFGARPAPDEVIVVDDGSRDDTAAAVAASYPAVRIHRHQRALGFTAAANAGLALARGEVLLLLNSDTEVAPDAPGAMLAALAAEPNLGVVGGALYYPDGEAQWSGGAPPGAAWLLALASGLPRRLRGWRWWRGLRPISGHQQSTVAWVTGAALALRRAVWEAAGPLDERFAFYAQDLDLCLRAGRLGWRVAVAPAARVVHHHGVSVAAAVGVDASRQSSALLWADMVRWVGKERGARAARRAATTLRLGAGLQSLLLRAEAMVPARRQRARAEHASLRAAAEAARRAARETAHGEGIAGDRGLARLDPHDRT
jgi:GT2 family glycosyltransferase